MAWLRRVVNFRLPWLIAPALTGMPAAAQDQPSAEPILRVENGVRTAPIKGAAADADDKAVRLWSLETGSPSLCQPCHYVLVKR
jgi:hypothetical protein